MATNPDYPSVKLTRPEIAYIVNRSGFRGEAAATAVAIAWGESRGVSNAFRPASMNPGGGNDHGIVQWNDRAHPDLDLREAYDPIYAVLRMARHVDANGGQDGLKGFGAWNVGPNHYNKTDGPRTFSAGDMSAARSAVASERDPSNKLKAAGLSSYGGDATPGQIAGAVVEAIPGGDTAAGVLDTVTAPYQAAAAVATRLGSVILDPTWWRRIGIGALGVALVVAAIMLTTRTTITQAAGTVAGIRKGSPS